METSSIEELAALGEDGIILRIRILEAVVREAQADGDERWKDLEVTQLEPLRQALSRVRKLAPIVIKAKVGVLTPRGGNNG